VVADRPERAGLRRGDDLEIADAGPTAGAPVDQGLRAVGEVRFVQALERDANGPGRALVHREAEPVPVGRRPDAPLLGQHQLAGLGDEGVHALEVALAPEAGPALPFPGEDPVKDELGRDRCVVEAGQEQRRVADHPGVPDHQVLDRGSLRMTQVQ